MAPLTGTLLNDSSTSSLIANDTLTVANDGSATKSPPDDPFKTFWIIIIVVISALLVVAFGGTWIILRIKLWYENKKKAKTDTTIKPIKARKPPMDLRIAEFFEKVRDFFGNRRKGSVKTRATPAVVAHLPRNFNTRQPAVIDVETQKLPQCVMKPQTPNRGPGFYRPYSNAYPQARAANDVSTSLQSSRAREQRLTSQPDQRLHAFATSDRLPVIPSAEDYAKVRQIPRSERIERPTRPARPELAERSARLERPQRPAHPARPESPKSPKSPERSERPITMLPSWD